MKNYIREVIDPWRKARYRVLYLIRKQRERNIELWIECREDYFERLGVERRNFGILVDEDSIIEANEIKPNSTCIEQSRTSE